MKALNYPLAALLAFTAVQLASGADDRSVSIEPRIRNRGQFSGAPDFRTDSGLVLIPVSVTDAANQPVTGLDRRLFRVYEDKVERTLLHFSCEDVPLTVGVVFDSSGSMSRNLAQARDAAMQFLRTANAQDEFFLVEFKDRARLTSPFSVDLEPIEASLLGTHAGGRTALIDAVQMALKLMKGAHNPRKALLVISDGGDNDSRFSAAEIRTGLREADTWIYAIGVYPQTVFDPDESPAGSRLLASLAADTGGRHFAVRRPEEIPAIVRQIGLDLRNRYLIGFRPVANARDGRYHRIQVKLANSRGLRLAYRPGYIDRAE